MREIPSLTLPSDSNFVSVTVSPEPSTTKLSVIAYDPVTGTSNNCDLRALRNEHLRAGRCRRERPGQGIATGSVTFLGIAELNSLTASTVSTPSSYTEAQENFLQRWRVMLFTASYGGDASFNASQSGQAPLTIIKAPTTASVSLSSATVSAAGTVTLIGIVNTQSYSSQAAPTGNVTFIAGSTRSWVRPSFSRKGTRPIQRFARARFLSRCLRANVLPPGANQISDSLMPATRTICRPHSSGATLTVTSTNLAVDGDFTDCNATATVAVLRGTGNASLRPYCLTLRHPQVRCSFKSMAAMSLRRWL